MKVTAPRLAGHRSLQFQRGVKRGDIWRTLLSIYHYLIERETKCLIVADVNSLAGRCISSYGHVTMLWLSPRNLYQGKGTIGYGSKWPDVIIQMSLKPVLDMVKDNE